MPHVVADRVLEASTSSGTGVFALAGAVLGFRAFAAVCAVSDTVPYFIEAVDDQGRPTGEWEFGLGTYSAANQLTRTTIRGSSNGGLAVSFPAGTKLVGLGIPAPASSTTRAEWRASLGATAVGESVFTAATQAAARTAIGVEMRETGETIPFMRTTAPAGWVRANGNTIGNAASGATERANADTEALFTMLWNEFTQAVLPIQTSAGGASTRGASAAVDYAANKRMPLPNLCAEFVRGWDNGRGVDAGRVFGSSQLDAFQGHDHTITMYGGSGALYGFGGNATGGSPITDPAGSRIGPTKTDGTNGAPRVSTETRPRNVALLWCVKL
ncbi:MAG: hypothetical protein KF871_10900 [Hydrogenophaga sp.]|uniref:hypothetical protein n=1 Tax=Hydrogenophaga sp. TaxID=1904254 RepID=UPI001D234041|nr:hypothetical protein [Hydrogenophaga sp.]MBX3610390.1 hypothetical protein [Hydrogenophaga sp.]